MLAVQNLVNQVWRLYVLSGLPGLAGHAHTKTVTDSLLYSCQVSTEA